MRRKKGKSGQTDGEQETQEGKLSMEGNMSEFILQVNILVAVNLMISLL